MSIVNLDFDTSTTQTRYKLKEIHQLKDKISFSCYAEFGKFWMISFAERQIVAYGHHSALGHSILILSHSQEKECGDY